MNSFIVITSIFDPTDAVKNFSRLTDHSLVVVGDKKSPKTWNCSNTKFLSVEEQEKMNIELIKVLPYNHYCRKMLGYIYAIKEGADVIFDTDDDNIPFDNWSFPVFEGKFDSIEQKTGFVNIYKYFTESKIWPRGLPLSLINDTLKPEICKDKTFKVGIWQALADEDPDVDAIYRLTSNKPCFFNKRPPIVLPKGVFSPFNTQNTAILKDLFPIMYLPSKVTFRFTDILRGIIAQPIMWAAGYHLGFTEATVLQKRNPHDFTKDFISEIPMYLEIENAANIASKTVLSKNTIADNLYNVYYELEKAKIVEKEELEILKAWLSDVG